MSNRLLNMVRDAKIGDPTAKEVLKCIADQSNDHGANVWSSIAYFEYSTERTRSTIKRALAFLKDEGFIEHAGWTEYGTHVWQVSVSALQAVQRTWRKDYEEGEGQSEPRVRVNQGEGQTEPLTPKEPKNKHSENVEEPKAEEPVYVDDGQDGVPYEWQIELDNFLTGWKTCFPNKTQPRRSGMIRKWRTRFQDEGFRANWRRALWATKDKAWAHKEGWFKWQWLLHNDENYEKLLDGTFDFKATQKAQQVTQPARKVEADISVDAWANRRHKDG